MDKNFLRQTGLFILALMLPLSSFGDVTSLLAESDQEIKNQPRTVAYDGEVISGRGEKSARNPVRFNPFLTDDDVYVEGTKDFLQHEGTSLGDNREALRNHGKR